jgi:hypothetical protein
MKHQSNHRRLLSWKILGVILGGALVLLAAFLPVVLANCAVPHSAATFTGFGR